MQKLRAYLTLCRVSNLPTVWTNVLAAMVLSTGAFNLPDYLPLVLAVSFFYLAGMSLNDICDLEIDRVQRPERPIIAGRVSLAEAKILTLALFLSGLVLLALAPSLNGLLAGGVLVATIVAYDLRHKNNPFSVLLMAACRFLVFAVVSFALTGVFAPLALLAGAIQFAYIVALSLMARHANTRTTPYRFPLMPALLSGIALLDGVVMAALVSLPWLVAGAAGAALTWIGQRAVRGD
jgi:4-hydroxybenzoate polyprenyltransferase